MSAESEERSRALLALYVLLQLLFCLWLLLYAASASTAVFSSSMASSDILLLGHL